ncbi:MAG: hypothetical protein GY719_31130 [bacterium]|nr:hypothetical protein [bacterium]
MTPRAFCREPGYTSAVLLTFDFNPLFFERLVLPELWAGGTGDVLVIADSRRVAEASSRWEDQLRHLGHRYQLIRASARGNFHPKVILRWGSEGGAVWVGSGNLTAGGWGANRELATSWRVGPGAADQGGWITDFVAGVGEWCPGGLEHDVLRSLGETPWVVSAADPDVASPLLVSHADRSLASQLAQRWHDRRFDVARVLTGSTDRDGALLRWLNSTFGVTRSAIALEPDRASFDPQRLERLPLDVEVWRHPDKRPIHAKLYWLDGPDGAAAVMGSANCSAAGWLQPPDQGGNVEVVTVYDQAPVDDFQPLLDLFEAEELEPATLVARDPETGGSEDTGTRQAPVAGIAWERDSGELRVSFARPVAEDAAVRLELLGREVPCAPTAADRSLWLALAAEPFEERRTLFAAVVIEVDGVLSRQHHWINDLAELRHASHGRRIVNTLENLGRQQSPREQQQIVVELQRIGAALLSDPAAFPDPLARSGEEKKEKEPDEPPAPSIDPDELVRSLEEVSSLTPESLPAYSPGILSLSGVMRALFDFAEGDDSEHDAAEEPEEDPEEDPPEPKQKKRKPAKKPPPEKVRKRLRDQMRQYLDQLGDQRYPETCTASQMVQAAAYPLAVAALGSRGGWVEDDEAQEWVVRVFDVLFREEFQHRTHGLIAAIRGRYRQGGQGDDFRRIVGDGTLWLALLNGLASLPWRGRNGTFEKALALRSVWGAKELLDSSDAGRMRTLVARLTQKRIKASLLATAPEAARQLGRLEAKIHERWSALIETQEAEDILHQPDDLLWRERVGWATVLEEEPGNVPLEAYLHFRSQATKVKPAGFYVNVTHAAEGDAEIASLLAAVQNPDVVSQ